MPERSRSNSYTCIGTSLTIIVGISYNEPSHFCTMCSMSFCVNCQGSHDISHLGHMVRESNMQWRSQMKSTKSVSICLMCSGEVKTRTECSDCLLACCFSCLGMKDVRKKWYDDHRAEYPRHKSFRVLHNPNSWVKPPLNMECGCWKVHGVLGSCYIHFLGSIFADLHLCHCSRCFKSMIASSKVAIITITC